MKRILASILLFLLTVGATCNPPPSKEAATFDRVLHGTVVLTADSQPFCAGAFVGSQVYTAAHCVPDSLPVEVVSFAAYRSSGDNFEHAEKATYAPIYLDETQDLAVLALLDGREPLYTPLRVSESAPRHGEPVWAIGSPSGLPWTVTEGIVSYPRRTRWDGMIWLQVSADIWFGNSGGPLVNRRGELVGIASFIRDYQNHLGGFVHWENLKKVSH